MSNNGRLARWVRVESIAWRIGVIGLAITYAVLHSGGRENLGLALLAIATGGIGFIAMVCSYVSQVALGLLCSNRTRQVFLKAVLLGLAAIACRLLARFAGIPNIRFLAPLFGGFYLFNLLRGHIYLSYQGQRDDLADDFEKHWHHHRYLVLGLFGIFITLGLLHLPRAVLDNVVEFAMAAIICAGLVLELRLAKSMGQLAKALAEPEPIVDDEVF